jgi:hypothetical protein
LGSNNQENRKVRECQSRILRRRRNGDTR